MSYRVKISDQAKADLRGIYSYIAVDLQSPQIAAGQIERIERGIYSLDEMPYRFRAYPKEPWYSRGLRVLSVDHYLILYMPDQNTETVSVVRIVYSMRDIDQVLKNTKMPPKR